MADTGLEMQYVLYSKKVIFNLCDTAHNCAAKHLRMILSQTRVMGQSSQYFFSIVLDTF